MMQNEYLIELQKAISLIAGHLSCGPISGNNQNVSFVYNQLMLSLPDDSRRTFVANHFCCGSSLSCSKEQAKMIYDMWFEDGVISSWNPIDTAPNDGSLFLLSSSPISVAKFTKFGTLTDGDWDEDIDGDPISLSGDFWMPLPAPPQACA